MVQRHSVQSRFFQFEVCLVPVHRCSYLGRAYMNLLAYFYNVRPEGLRYFFLLKSVFVRSLLSSKRIGCQKPHISFCTEVSFIHDAIPAHIEKYEYMRKQWIKLDEQKLSLHCIFSSDDTSHIFFSICLACQWAKESSDGIICLCDRSEI